VSILALVRDRVADQGRDLNGLTALNRRRLDKLGAQPEFRRLSPGKV
jgi:hypothetical protein